jgi:ABC-type transport system involved in cytochrome c biogenesis ATPase subunit
MACGAVLVAQVMPQGMPQGMHGGGLVRDISGLSEGREGEYVWALKPISQFAMVFAAVLLWYFHNKHLYLCFTKNNK